MDNQNIIIPRIIINYYSILNLNFEFYARVSISSIEHEHACNCN